MLRVTAPVPQERGHVSALPRLTFGQLFAIYFGTRSQSAVARQTGIDRAYVHRILRRGIVPSRSIVVRLAEALELDGTRRDRLLVSANHRPEGLTDWDETVALVADVLGDHGLSATHRRQFGDAVRALASAMVGRER